MAGEYMNPSGSYPRYGMMQRGINPFDELRAKYDQELKTLAQQLGMFQQPINQYAPPQNPGFTVRPATNIQEVQSCFIEALTTNVFVNLAQGEIYLSRINDNGLKDIQVFKLYQGEENANEQGDAFNKSKTVIANIDLSEINTRLDRLENLIGRKSNESDSNHGTGSPKRRQPASSYESGSNAAVGSTGTN